MSALAWILGILGALSAIFGILTAIDIFPLLGADLTAMFWLTLSIIFFLACIAAAIGARRVE